MHLQAISDKIFLRQQLIVWLNGMRFKNEKLVFTNGCFDLLHQGHIDYLAKAADLGTKLIVGVNSDNSVKRLGKGSSRPIQNEQSRALLLAALHFTSAITVFDEDTPYQLIELVKPNVLVKGADWKVEKIVGYDLVKANGGEVVTIEFLPGFSTTAIEDKIKSS
ncbi:MAG TPA: D-glycero-beta-D-manno-heptose 1-phosphate adenylyltransferase [Bacteroidia bacterium]|nr:D-glycero-beta-D-manno-heptose 1-phosphate adenylyltransferase [Bacteroidia bacterium]HRH09398.1 D-glycero-beta-D-manno-heptose 1-phosphate adenylyltransferase [Bacteroidia bacterium]